MRPRFDGHEDRACNSDKSRIDLECAGLGFRFKV